MECVRRSQLRNAMVYWIATRGTPTDSHRDLRACKNNFMAWAIPYRSIVPRDQLERGGGAHVYVSTVLRQPPESSDPTVKNYARLDFARALLEAYEHSSDYPVLLDRDGNITEGRGWNIFAVLGETLVTPDHGILEGITRRTVVELAGKAGISCNLGSIKGSELEFAKEIFITSTAGGVMPVTHVNGLVINNGAPGPITVKLHDTYWALHDEPSYTTQVDYD
jgi:branched-chain amino acid aminotransferase